MISNGLLILWLFTLVIAISILLLCSRVYKFSAILFICVLVGKQFSDVSIGYVLMFEISKILFGMTIGYMAYKKNTELYFTTLNVDNYLGTYNDSYYTFGNTFENLKKFDNDVNKSICDIKKLGLSTKKLNEIAEKIRQKSFDMIIIKEYASQQALSIMREQHTHLVDAERLGEVIVDGIKYNRKSYEEHIEYYKCIILNEIKINWNDKPSIINRRFKDGIFHNYYGSNFTYDIKNKFNLYYDLNRFN